MEPRSDDRGEKSAASRRSSPYQSLQWSRGRMTAERASRIAVEARSVHASMEPRSDDRGEWIRVGDSLPHVEASMEPRSDDRGESGGPSIRLP